MHIALVLALIGSAAPGRIYDRPQEITYRRTTRGQVNPGGWTAVDHTGGAAFFTFADPTGASMGAACAGTTPSASSGVLTFSRASVAECISTDGQTITQVASGQPRVMSGAVDDPILGVMAEGESHTNYCYFNHDLSNAVWTASNMTCTKTATGLRGTPNSASHCVATGTNATICQTIAYSVSHEHADSWYLKRSVGAGAVTLSSDGITYLANLSSSLSSTKWKRAGPQEMVGCTAGTSPSFTGSLCIVQTGLHVTGVPVLCLKLATSGDAVDVDFVQSEDNNKATSPIETLTAANQTRASELVDAVLNWTPDGGTATYCAAATVVTPSAGMINSPRLHGVPGDGTQGGGNSATYDDSFWNTTYTTEFHLVNTAPNDFSMATGLNPGGGRMRSVSYLEPYLRNGCVGGLCGAGTTAAAFTGKLENWPRYRLGGYNTVNGTIEGVIKDVQFDAQPATCRRTLDSTLPTTYAVAIGDSITCCPDGEGVGWPQFANYLWAGQRQVANYAKGATYTADALNTQWEFFARHRRYNHLFVLSGTNDVFDVLTPITVAQIEANLLQIVTEGIADGVRVHLMTLLPRGGSLGWTALMQTRLETVNAYILSLCATYVAQGVTCIDTYNSNLRATGADGGTWFLATWAQSSAADGLHPGLDGGSYIAGLINAAVPLP